MAAGTELESLVIRLTGDSEEFSNMLERAQSLLEDTARQVKQMTSEIETAGGTAVKGAAEQAGKAAEAFSDVGAEAKEVKIEVEKAGHAMENTGTSLNNLGTVASGVRDVFGEWKKTLIAATTAWIILRTEIAVIGAFAEYERQQLRLGAVLRVNERDVRETTGRYREFAANMARVTTTSASATMRMLQQAEVFGFTGDAAERLVRDSIGLAAATGQEAEAFLTASIAMQRGNVHYIARLLRIRDLRSEAVILAEVQKMVGRGMQIAEEETKSASHQIELMQRNFKKLTIEMGEVMAKIFLPLIKAVSGLTEWFLSLSPAIKTVVLGVVDIAGLATVIGALFAVIKLLGPALLGSWILVKFLIKAFIALRSVVIAANLALGTAMVLSAVALTAAVALLAYGLYQVAKAFIESADAAREAERRMEAMAVTVERVREQQRRLREEQVRLAEAGIGRPQETAEALGRVIALQEQQVQSLRINMQRMHAAIAEAQRPQERQNVPWWQSLLEPMPTRWAEPVTDWIATWFSSSAFTQSAQHITQQQQLVADAERDLAALRDRLTTVTETATRETDRLANALLEERRVIGLTADEARLANLQFLQATDVQGLFIEALTHSNQELKDEAKLDEDVEEFTRSLREQGSAIGRTTDKARLYALELRGASFEQLAGARAAIRFNEALREQEELARKAQGIVEELRTPLEKFNLRMRELSQMFTAGLLHEDTFDRASQAAVDSFNNIEEAVRDARHEIGRFDAALLGSSEFLTRLEQQRALFRIPGRAGITVPEGGGAVPFTPIQTRSAIAGAAGALTGENRAIVTLLGDVVQQLRIANRRPQLVLEPAGFR